MYKHVIEDFEDIIDIKDTFNSLSFNYALHSLKESTSNLKFLIGVPGSGKTFLLKSFKDKDKNYILVTAPLTKKNLDTIIQLHSHIMIDEAQLLDMDLIEYIRTLTDTKEYTIILSMHQEEAEKILNLEHFKSRSIDIIQLNLIKKEEMIQYLNIKLLKNSANHLFSMGEFNKIYKYTNGNFRYIKKFIKTLFELLEYAYENKLKKYQKINSCLITMTAIKLGLENG